MNRLLRWIALSATLLAGGCAQEQKTFTVSVSPGTFGPRIDYPEPRGNGRTANVVFQGKFLDSQQEALLTLIRAQGWKVSGTSTEENGLPQAVSESLPHDDFITRESIGQPIETRNEGTPAADPPENPQ
ncbi:hypothetical protein KBB96_08920 [Luteolibacter ambystomatis]|uniref:Lipoprotein n=1 Tax=Luteolibacter ambystomatis TaxID=2824561 RepID=A0A975J2W6_9BACT|nr:hypothetical protein [Luteolibacter ambystomatis]QUE52999.1 hypothetical protein KBB96_08920 [Luteolibacter ambystomatis]